jgi:hypothetical protein
MSSKETKNKSRLYLSALLLLAATAVLSTVTPTGNNVFAQDDSEENSNGNSGNVEDNGNADNPGGMGNCNNSPDDCEPQKDRVGNDDDTDTDADRDGPGGEGGSCDSDGCDPGQGNTGDPSDEGEANCWGKVSSALGQTQDHPAHAADPVPGDRDNETPREGVGNQQEGHPSDHADTVGGFLGIDEPCVD